MGIVRGMTYRIDGNVVISDKELMGVDKDAKVEYSEVTFAPKRLVYYHISENIVFVMLDDESSFWLVREPALERSLESAIKDQNFPYAFPITMGFMYLLLLFIIAVVTIKLIF